MLGRGDIVNEFGMTQVHQQYGQATGLAQQLVGRLAELQRISQQMESTWRMQVLRESSSKSSIWKLKVEQVSEETDALRAALDKYTHKEGRWVELAVNVNPSMTHTLCPCSHG